MEITKDTLKVYTDKIDELESSIRDISIAIKLNEIGSLYDKEQSLKIEEIELNYSIANEKNILKHNFNDSLNFFTDSEDKKKQYYVSKIKHLEEKLKLLEYNLIRLGAKK